MYKHHQESMKRVVEYFENDLAVQGLLLGGSIAHSFAGPTSDIDIMIIIADDNYRARLKRAELQFFSKELCTYEGGYVDGKYLGTGLLQEMKDKGSEPARYAFQDVKVLLSRLESLEDTVRDIACYPVEQKVERIQRFYAQFETWHWYTGEALRLQNHYLLNVTVNKLVLFGGRLILAHNELLYPYHKWFLKVLEGAKERPPELLRYIDQVYQQPNQENIESFYELVKDFREWEKGASKWPNQFMIDSELTWRNGFPPIDDI